MFLNLKGVVCLSSKTAQVNNSPAITQEIIVIPKETTKLLSKLNASIHYITNTEAEVYLGQEKFYFNGGSAEDLTNKLNDFLNQKLIEEKLNEANRVADNLDAYINRISDTEAEIYIGENRAHFMERTPQDLIEKMYTFLNDKSLEANLLERLHKDARKISADITLDLTGNRYNADVNFFDQTQNFSHSSIIDLIKNIYDHLNTKAKEIIESHFEGTHWLGRSSITVLHLNDSKYSGRVIDIFHTLQQEFQFITGNI